MSGIMQDLHTIGLNPFAAVLLAESLLKSPLAEMTVGKPQGFFMPINRADCPGWAGVRITVEAVLPAESLAQPAARCPLCRYQHGHQIGCENNPVDIALKAAQPDDDAEKASFYAMFGAAEKATGHKPSHYDVWLMARGLMTADGRCAQPVQQPTTQPAESTTGQPLRTICWANCPCRKAVQPVQQPGAEPEPITVEAVAEVRSGDDGLYLDWLIEGGICALVEGCVLVMPSQPITDDEGSGEVYLAAPAQRQPLTQDEILDMADGVSLQFHDLLEFARAIEAAHGITAAAAAQKGEKL